MPTQVFVSITPGIRRFFEEECRAEGAAERHAGVDSIDLDDLYRLVDEHNTKGGKPVGAHALLEGAEVTDRREACNRTLSDLERMRLDSEERQYQRMIGEVKPLMKVKRKEPASYQYGLRFATNFATQVVVAFIGAFLLGYYFVETFVAPDSFNAKVIAGSFCSFATLLCETLLLVVHEQKKEMIEQKQRLQEEKVKRRPLPRRSAQTGTAAKPAHEPTPDVGRGQKPAQEKKED